MDIAFNVTAEGITDLKKQVETIGELITELEEAIRQLEEMSVTVTIDRDNKKEG